MEDDTSWKKNTCQHYQKVELKVVLVTYFARTIKDFFEMTIGS